MRRASRGTQGRAVRGARAATHLRQRKQGARAGLANTRLAAVDEQAAQLTHCARLAYGKAALVQKRERRKHEGRLALDLVFLAAQQRHNGRHQLQLLGERLHLALLAGEERIQRSEREALRLRVRGGEGLDKLIDAARAVRDAQGGGGKSCHSSSKGSRTPRALVTKEGYRLPGFTRFYRFNLLP